MSRVICSKAQLTRWKKTRLFKILEKLQRNKMFSGLGQKGQVGNRVVILT